MKIAVITVLLLSLAGCATYAPPKSGPTAQIKFLGGAYVYIDESSTAGRSCTSVPQAVGENFRNQVIPADRRLWIQQGVDTRGLAFGMFCGFAYSFMPEKDANYLSEYVMYGGRCSISLMKQAESGAWLHEPSLEQQPKGCF